MACLSLVSLPACAGRGERAPEVHIGVLASLTGQRLSISGTATKEGAELATAELNRDGGVDIGGVRHRVVAVLADVGEATSGATSAAQTLLTRPDIVGIIGPQYSRNAVSVASLAENAHVPMITPMATHPAVTAGRRWVFRIAYTDDFQAGVLARWALEGLHARRAALLYEESAPYSRDIATAFSTTFMAAGGRIVAQESYTRDRAGDFREALVRIARTSPDVLLLPNELPDDTLQMTQARAAGIRAPFLLPDFVDAGIMSQIPAAAGLYTTHHWHPGNPDSASRAFVALYSRTYRGAPKVTAAATYDAIMLLCDAMRRARTTQPDSVRAALAATSSFRGVTGLLRFDGAQDPRKSASVLHLEHGHLDVVHVVNP